MNQNDMMRKANEHQNIINMMMHQQNNVEALLTNCGMNSANAQMRFYDENNADKNGRFKQNFQGNFYFKFILKYFS